MSKRSLRPAALVAAIVFPVSAFAQGGGGGAGGGSAEPPGVQAVARRV
jgi:hypothetical protein